MTIKICQVDFESVYSTTLKQFLYIVKKVKSFQREKQPVISVDTKKKGNHSASIMNFV